MLKKLNIPRFTERLYAFTMPEQNKIFACDHDESFLITLSDQPTVSLLDHRPYEFVKSLDNPLGAIDGVPIHESYGRRISYTFDGRNDYVEVTISLDSTSEKLSFRTLSGDWFAATFSRCGRYLILAEPYLLECYEFT